MRNLLFASFFTTAILVAPILGSAHANVLVGFEGTTDAGASINPDGRSLDLDSSLIFSRIPEA